MPVPQPAHSTPTAHRFNSAVAPHLRDLRQRSLALTRGHEHDAEDLYQSTMLKAWGMWSADIRDARVWLYTIMRHTYVTLYRTNRRRLRNIARYPDGVLTALYDPAPAEEGACDETVAALDQLAPKYRDIIALSLRDVPYDEMAVTLGLPIGTIMSRLHRARRLLESKLSDVARRDYGLGLAAAG